MKHNIFIKLLAILLCAASLMGIVGGAAGALVLVEGDLYNKTVDEVIHQRIQNLAVESANQIASRYADQTLGGCPEEISRSYGRDLLSWNFTDYGYAILDSDGNVLESLNPELKDSTQVHSIPVTGQYMHLVSTETDSQAMEAASQKHLEAYGSAALADIDGVSVPVEGIAINHVIFTGQDGQILYEASCDGLTGSSTYFYRDYLLDNGTVDSFAAGEERGKQGQDHCGAAPRLRRAVSDHAHVPGIIIKTLHESGGFLLLQGCRSICSTNWIWLIT